MVERPEEGGGTVKDNFLSLLLLLLLYPSRSARINLS